jgi:L-alanine-DL-glutamate epimerase-like enolase superfamily enzyme
MRITGIDCHVLVEPAVDVAATSSAQDDLAGHRRLAEEQPIPIASGEWLTTRHEFADLLERGRVAVAQPDVGRGGGLTEARRVCDLAAAHGARVVPHAWKTGISIAAAAHLAAAREVALIEFLPAALRESGLREELRLVDGTIPLPTRPGLGVDLDRDALARYRAVE